MSTLPIVIPPGLNSDDTTFSTKARWADADGMRFVLGKAETIEQYSTIGASGLSSVTKLLVYKVGSTAKIAAAGAALSSVTTLGVATTITPGGGGWTGTQFCLDMWGDELLAQCSGGKLFTSVAGATATEITQSPDQITAMIVTPERQVLALGCNEEVSTTFNGRCIRGCDLEDYTDWTTTASNNAFEHILAGQANIVSGTVFGNYVLVWTTEALWLGQFLGDPSQTYKFDKVDGGAGLAGLNAFAIVEGVVYWVSPSLSFYAYSVGGPVVQIPCPISKDFVDNAIGGLPSIIYACGVRRHREIWFGYGDVRDAGVGSAVSRFLIYSVGESQAAGAHVWSRATSLGLLNKADAGAMTDSPNAPISDARDVFVATAGGNIYRAQQGSNGPTTAYIQSADFYIDEGNRRAFVQGFVPDFEYQSNTVTLAISARDRPQSTPVTDSYSILTSDTKKDFRKSGMIFSMKLTTGTGSRLRLGRPQFLMSPAAGGRR